VHHSYTRRSHLGREPRSSHVTEFLTMVSTVFMIVSFPGALRP